MDRGGADVDPAAGVRLDLRVLPRQARGHDRRLLEPEALEAPVGGRDRDDEGPGAREARALPRREREHAGEAGAPELVRLRLHAQLRGRRQRAAARGCRVPERLRAVDVAERLRRAGCARGERHACDRRDCEQPERRAHEPSADGEACLCPHRLFSPCFRRRLPAALPPARRRSMIEKARSAHKREWRNLNDLFAGPKERAAPMEARPRLRDHAAGRGWRGSGRDASRRAFRRVSSTITLAGRTACAGRAATRTRCRCISSPLVVWWWASAPRRRDGAGRGARGPVPRARCDVAPGRDPSQSRGWDSNPRSRAHEAREDNRSSTAQRSPPTSRPREVGAGRCRLCHAAPVGAAMLFMPLACASTLDRPPPDARPECGRPSWRRSGARRLRRSRKCAGKSSGHMDSVIYRAETRRDLSL